jgi:SPFH domain / Band 7 family
MRADIQGGQSGPVMGYPRPAPRPGLLATVMKWFGRVNVPPDHVGILRRRFGPADPEFLRVSSGDQRGWQARTLRPGAPAWLSFGRYQVAFVPRIHVPENMTGLVTAKDGRQRPRGRRLGGDVACDNFQDGRAFLLGGGEQGRQVATLAGGHSYSINTRLFDVEFVPRTYVPVGTIGLVIALDGKVGAAGSRLARHVECDSFQDGQAFYDGGGEQGRQLAVLAGGTSYDINPALFAVITVDNVAGTGTRDGLTAAHLTEFAVKTGMVGVVVTLDGAPSGGSGTVGPRVEGHQGFRLPWVFLDGGGRKGVQEQTLSEGSTCALNPWFVRVVLIPTHQITLDWSKTPAEKAGNYDAELARITVTVQGYPVHMELSQTLQIPESAAPRLVSVFGVDAGSAPLGGLVDDRAPVQRFVQKVLGATVKGYLSGIAASSTVQEFIGKYEAARRELSDKVAAELRSWHVVPGKTSLGGFESKESHLNAELQAAANAEAHGKVLDLQAQNAKRQAEIAATLMQSKLMEADPHLWSQVKALGIENVVRLRIVEALSTMDSPKVISGGADLGGLLPLHSLLRDLVNGEKLRHPDRALLDDGGDLDVEAIDGP